MTKEAFAKLPAWKQKKDETKLRSFLKFIVLKFSLND